MASHTIRLEGDSKNTNFSVVDSLTSEPLFWWRGNDLRIEISLSDAGKFLTSGDIGSINVVVKNLDAAADDAALMIATIGASDCDSTFTANDFDRGVKQLCVAEFTRVESALDAGEYAIVISHTDPSGKRSTHLHSRILVKEDQHDSLSLSAPPTPAPEYYSQEESDARFSKRSESALEPFIKIEGANLDITGVDSASQIIQDVINDSPDNSIIVFPAGATLLCRNLTIPSNRTIRAHGCKFVLGGDDPTGFAFGAENTQSGIWNVYGTMESRLENITILGGEYVGSRSADDWSTFGSEDGLQFVWVDNLTIKDTVVHDWMQDGIELKGCRYAVVENNYIYDTVDAACEVRGGHDLCYRNNLCRRTRNGFMTKPFDQADGSVEDAVRYNVLENVFECFDNSIVNNWANHSRFNNNVINPVSVPGHDGATRVAIVHEEHPVTVRGEQLMDGIETKGNILVSSISNTFMRLIGPNAVSYGSNYVSDNKVNGDVTRGFELSGVVSFINNHVSNVTGVSNNFSALITSDKSINIEGNTMQSGRLQVSQTLGSDISFKISSNQINILVLISGNVSAVNNSISSVVASSDLSSLLMDGNRIKGGVNTPLNLEADNSIITNNEISSTGNLYAVRANFSGGIIANNIITKNTGNLSAVEVFAAKINNTISGNTINGVGITGSSIRVFGDRNKVINNITEGGNQNIRISGDNNDVIGNTCNNANFQNIDVQAGAANTILHSNTTLGSGTGLSNSGVNSIVGQNRNL